MNLAQENKFWDDVEAKLRRTVPSYQGNPLSRRDSVTYAASLALSCCHLVDLRNRFGSVGSNRELVAWVHFVHSLDVFEFASFLSDATVVLRNVHSPQSVSWFKRQLVQYPFVGMAVVPIRDSLKSFLGNPQSESFYICNQFFSFLTKVSLQDTVLDMEPAYLELEADLSEACLPASLTGKLNLIIREWMSDFRLTPDTFIPKHGPGGTADLPRTATINAKYSDLKYDQMLAYVVERKIGLPLTDLYPYWKPGLKRQSTVVDVPKSLKTRRVISKEPTALQYIQQGIDRAMKHYIAHHGYLQDHLSFEDQTYNGSLCSDYRNFATIDLSAASDLVSTDLVKACFRGTHALPILLGTRSRTSVLKSGKVVALRKFAPMGSAMCFPVESLIFAAAVEHAVRRARATWLGHFPSWRVYGDDIVVAAPLYEDVVMVLEAIGLRVNASKSYTLPTRFRESCGVEVYDDVDVSPLRISRQFYWPEDGLRTCHAALYEALQGFANLAGSKQFPLLRLRLIRMIFGCTLGRPPFSRSGRVGLASLWADNFSAPRRIDWDDGHLAAYPSYQRVERQVVRAHTRPRKKVDVRDDDTGRYYETLRQTRSRVGDMFSPDHRVVVPSGSVVSRLQRTWVSQDLLE